MHWNYRIIFRVDFPDCGGETIYEAEVGGDGTFLTEERQRYIYDAVRAIESRLAKDNLIEN